MAMSEEQIKELICSILPVDIMKMMDDNGIDTLTFDSTTFGEEFEYFYVATVNLCESGLLKPRINDDYISKYKEYCSFHELFKRFTFTGKYKDVMDLMNIRGWMEPEEAIAELPDPVDFFKRLSKKMNIQRAKNLMCEWGHYHDNLQKIYEQIKNF